MIVVNSLSKTDYGNYNTFVFAFNLFVVLDNAKKRTQII